MIDAHADALQAHLEAAGCRVYRGGASPTGYPYVVLYVDAGRRNSERLTARRHRADFYVQTTVVAAGVDQHDALRARVVDALADYRPVVAGRLCGLLEHATSRVMAREDDSPAGVEFYGVDVWLFTSTAAA